MAEYSPHAGEGPPTSRVWAMPSPYTFSIPPITAWLQYWLGGRTVVIDPFAGRSTLGTHRNDLSTGMDAEAFVRGLPSGVIADALLFDPPYSPRQISEVYKGVGLTVGMKETQSAVLYKRVRDAMQERSRIGTIGLSFGWNSAGFGKKRGWEQREILLVAHGGAHNDTICVCEERVR